MKTNHNNEVFTNINCLVQLTPAIKIDIDLNGNVKDYALQFLRLYNNAREFHNTILKIYNHYNNVVTIIIKESAKDMTIEWLKTFDYKEIHTETCKILTINPTINKINDTLFKIIDEHYINTAWEEELYTELLIEV